MVRDVLAEVRESLDPVLKQLRDLLGDGLVSCSVYGSAVRGNWTPGISDINLLIVLGPSTEGKHQALSSLLESHPRVDPFVVPSAGFDRTARVFATKFQSIQRHYHLLHGADLLSKLRFEASLERFLCEQALRNFRLRLVQSYLRRHRTKRYARFCADNVTPLFVQLSEALRLSGVAVPKDFADRIPLIERHFKIDGAVLRDLLRFKSHSRPLDDAETTQFHLRILPFIDAVLAWIEIHWTMMAPAAG